MAITSITIENFKCIGDAVTVPIRPITLLFGKNSSGKSTVLQALLYLRKICKAEPEPWELGGRGEGYGSGSDELFGEDSDRVSSDSNREIDPNHFRGAGDFRSLVHRHELDRKIRIRLEFDIKSEDVTKSKSAWIEIITGCDGELHIKPDKTALQQCRRELRDLLELGPVRDVPKQALGSTSDFAKGTWTTGLEAWYVLKQDSQLREKTNQYMEKLALGYSFRYSENGEHEIQLYDEIHKIDVHPLHVGFGISQVIPVVVGALENSRQLFAVEQPELHIHPALQVALGDLFIDGIKNSNRTMLIETHSEHLLLRVLRRVRETNVRNSKKYEWRQSSMPPLHREMSEEAIRDAENQDSKDHQLTPDDLSIVYVLPTSEGVEFIPLTVTDDGDFDGPWPEGFFDERVKELL